MSEPGIHKLIKTGQAPFAMIPNSVIRDPEITANAFRLLAYLMSHENGYELTYGQIERQTGLGRSAINSAIKLLGVKGYLVTAQTKLPNGYFGPKTWTLLDPSTVDETATDSNRNGVAPHGAINGLKENNLIREDNLDKKIKEKETLLSFETFYNHYPNARGKTEALKAYRKAITKLSADEINQAAIRFANDPNLPIEIYIPMPQTWLNQERWADPPLPENPLNTKPAKQTKAIGDW